MTCLRRGARALRAWDGIGAGDGFRAQVEIARGDVVVAGADVVVAGGDAVAAVGPARAKRAATHY